MLIILNNEIRMIDSLYSLNDLHRASGGENKYSPFRFMRLTSTKALIKEIERSPDVVSGRTGNAYKMNTQGTYVCFELVYSYAIWINAKFALIVIRAFHSMSIEQSQLNIKLSQLCTDFIRASEGASNAGRYLNILGKQIKPELKKQIDVTLKKIQLSFNFDNAYELDDAGGYINDDA